MQLRVVSVACCAETLLQHVPPCSVTLGTCGSMHWQVATLVVCRLCGQCYQLQQMTVLGAARPVLSLTGPVAAGRLNLQAATTPGLCACAQLFGVMCYACGEMCWACVYALPARQLLGVVGCLFPYLLLSRCATSAASTAEPRSTEPFGCCCFFGLYRRPCHLRVCLC